MRKGRMGLGRLVAFTIALMMVAAACGDDNSATTTSAQERFSVGVVFIYANPFATGVELGMRSVAEDNNVDIQFANANGDAQLEAAAVQNFIALGVDLLIYAPLDPSASVVNVEAAAAAGIPVICFDSCVNEDAMALYVAGYVTSDNTKLGEISGALAADYITAQMGGAAQAGFLTCEVFDICGQRRHGIDSALSALQVEVLASQEGYISDRAEPLAENMLTANPDINIFIAENEGGLQGAAAAIRALGLSVPVFGIDMDPSIAELLLADDNIVQGTAGQNTFGIGEKALQMGLDLLRGNEISKEPVLIDPLPYSREDPEAVRQFIADFGG